MLKYILGLIFNLFKHKVSLFAMIDDKSWISKKAKINQGVKLVQSRIKEYSYVGPGSQLICADIGKFCSIANDCSIGLADHSKKNISTSPIFTSKANGTGYSWTHLNSYKAGKRVTIGNDVWIGAKVIILGGIEVGDGAIIGAGSIVTKDIPNYAVAVGIPAKVIKYRFEEPIIEKLLETKWWDIPEKELKKKVPIFQIENITLNDLNQILS